MMPDFTKMKLPRRNPSGEIEQKYLKEVLGIFTLDLFEIGQLSFDKGIDSYIELKTGDNYSGVEFVVQFKSKEKSLVRKLKKGEYFSASIETSNINYIINHTQPSIYVLYINETGKFYYEWAVDFARRLSKKNPNWKDQDSHTLRFVKELNAEEGVKIYEEVKRKGEEHRRERDYLIEGDLSIITNSMFDKKKDNVLEAFQDLFETFSCFGVLPRHIIERVPPFAESSKSRCYYSEDESTLFTDNVRLIRFFESLARKGNKINLSDAEYGQSLRHSKRVGLVKDILNFFYRNDIHHLRVLSDRHETKRICVHKLYVSGSCDCEQCSYYRLDLKNSISRITSAKPKGSYEHLRLAHTLLELGEFGKAYEQFNKVSKEFKKSGDYASYFMCRYNLSRVTNLFYWNYLEKDHKRVIDELKSVKPDDEIYYLQKHHQLSDEAMSVLKWINNGEFINYSQRRLDKKVSEISSTYRSDKLGGWTSVNHFRELRRIFQETTVFIESNLLMYERVPGYESFIEKSFEAMLMLYCLYNENNNALKGFSYDTLRVLTIHGSAAKMNELLHKYNIDELPFEPDDNSRLNFIKLGSDFTDSLTALDDVVKVGVDSENHFLRKKLNEMASNLCVLLSVTVLDEHELNSMVEKLVMALNSSKLITIHTVRHLVPLIDRKYKNLHPEILESLYTLSFTCKKFDIIEIRTGLPKLFKGNFPKFNLKDSTLQCALGSMRNDDLKFEVFPVIQLWRIVSHDVQKEISDAIVKKLSNRFDFDDYYYASIYGVINHQIFWKELLMSIPKTANEIRADKMFSSKKLSRNRRLNCLVDLAFKYGIDLNSDEVKSITPDDSYYHWLLHLDSFDYKKFNPMWLLEFHSKYYMNEFKKYSQIRNEAKKHALRFRVEGLMRMYIEHFAA